MAEAPTKLSVKTEPRKTERPSALQRWHPFESLRREIDQLFESFDRGFWDWPFRRSVFDIQPFWRREPSWATPPVDIVEKDKAYELTVELPGMSERDIEVRLADGELTIRGEKKQEEEEKGKNYYVAERSYGMFERRFDVPESVDADKIAATFKNGVLTLTLPKKPEAQKAQKKIEVKAA